MGVTDIGMKEVLKRWKKEQGNMTILFAASLFLILFFVGIGVDLSLYYMRRNDLENLCRLLREDRFTYQDTIRYANNPGAAMFKIASDTMKSNQFSGEIKVFFKEEPFPAAANERKYKTRVQISEKFNFYFLQIFSLKTAPVVAYVDGVEQYGESGLDVIWHPDVSVDAYNGSYTGTVGSAYTFSAKDYPSGW